MQQQLRGHIFSWAPPDDEDIVVELACDHHDWELAFHGPPGAEAPAPEVAAFNIETDDRVRMPLAGAGSVAVVDGALSIQLDAELAARIGCGSDMRITPTDEADWADAQVRLAFILDPVGSPLPARLAPRDAAPRRGFAARLFGR